MKIINTSKCTIIATTPNGNKKEENKVSNIKAGDIVRVIYRRFNKKDDTQESMNLTGLTARVKKINCDQRTVTQNEGIVLQVQLDLLVETKEKNEFYVASIDVKKIGTGYEDNRPNNF